MPAPAKIVELIERFRANRESYRGGAYKEDQLRIEFLNPLFEALGWDVANAAGYAEAYKDVVHEDAIKIGGATKAPDYCFRIGGARKFFVEAKKPSVVIKDEPAPAYQLRRYAWSAKLPLSILTDFEELAVYDCRLKPHKTDKASTGRTLYFTVEELAAKWDELAAVFSREAVLKGSFDKYAEGGRGKKGTAEVDAAFLEEIESWRSELARNIAVRNPKLSVRDLNFAVGRTIDRIIFLRIAEDRGIESYGALMALLNGERVYKRLLELFNRADERYNSGLFHFRHEAGQHEPPDELTVDLKLDDAPLQHIIRRLYYPESPYEFAVLPADILGQVYEQFLGKVIRLTAGHQAKVEDKPEVKKAGGVYYTPTYIVDYIVRNTVGKCLEGKTPRQVSGVGAGLKPAPTGSRRAPLRVLDPACGSGSFLIGTYQFLLDWYRDQYVAEGPEKHRKDLYQGPGGEWRLSTAERKRILLAHIYGVDIDQQAVEVTKLSLLLKVLEGESGESLRKQLQIFHERALPDLGANIKCGNSLIGPDFYEGQQGGLFGDEEERYRVNAFDWRVEFPEVFAGRGGDAPVSKTGAAAGGFDCVVGNPPYVRMEEFKELKDYLKRSYACHDERSDLYAYFIERAHQLVNGAARFGMIVSNKFLRANYGKPLRDFIFKNAAIERITDFAGLPVFTGATVRTIVLLTSRQNPGTKATLYSPPPDEDTFTAIAAGSLLIEKAVSETTYEVPPAAFSQPVWSFSERGIDDLLTKLKTTSVPLSQYCEGQICRGVVSGLTEAFVIDAETRAKLIKASPKAKVLIKPFLNGRDVRRYAIEPKDIYLIYTHHGVDLAGCSAVTRHLEKFKTKLHGRATKQEWYELQQPQLNFAKFMDGSKIIFPDIATEPRFALDDTGCYSSNTTYFIPRRDLYLLGLLNSRVGSFYFSKTCAGLEGKNETYLRFFGQYLEGCPIRPIDFSNPADQAAHDRLVSLVDRMLDLHKKLAAAKSPDEKTRLDREIKATDAEIDRLVYELYGLTEAEIAIVEGSNHA